MTVTIMPGEPTKLSAAVAALPFRAGRRDEGAVGAHLTLLETLASMDGISIALYDLAERRYRFLRTGLRELLGLPAQAASDGDLGFFAERIHPEDRDAYYGTSQAVLAWLMLQDPGDRKDYRTYVDFRILTAAGVYTRLAQQNSVLETDADGLPWLVLTLVEPSKIRDCGLPLRRSCKRKSTGEFFLFPEGDRTIAPELSPREAEILSLVSKGFSSADIAGLLYLSVHTVNAHRRNILSKLDAENASDAVRYAAERGFI